MREMKDSGIGWIGAIPSEWNTIHLRHIADVETGNMDTQNNDPDGAYPFYVRSPIVERSNTYTFDDTEAILMAGDGVGAGRVFHLVRGKYGCHQRVYRLNNFKYTTAPFLKYYLESIFPFIMDQGSAKSTVDSVRLPMLKSFDVLVPNLDQQKQITAYLDHRCATIDTLIANQQKQIEKLKQYKQALITEAVTRGLDLNVQMKDSGVEWIGQVPEHWEIRRVKHIGSTQNGLSKGGEFFGTGFPFVSYGDAYRNYSLPMSVKGLVQSTEAEQENYSVRKGDIFFTRTSETIEEVGFSCVCEETIEQATFAGFLIRLRPYKVDSLVLTRYAKYYFRGSHIRKYLVKEMNIVTRASLGQSLLGAMSITVPPIQEQEAIAAYLDTKCAQIDALIAVKQQKADKLAQYKKSLIYEVVTGKREVHA